MRFRKEERGRRKRGRKEGGKRKWEYDGLGVAERSRKNYRWV